VPVGDRAAFAREVKRLADDGAARTALGVRGRQVYDERFDLAHTISALRQTAVAVSTR